MSTALCSSFRPEDVASDPANEGLGLALIEASMHAKPLIRDPPRRNPRGG